MADPDFVRELWAGDSVDIPIELDPATRRALRDEIEELQRARDYAIVTGQRYMLD